MTSPEDGVLPVPSVDGQEPTAPVSETSDTVRFADLGLSEGLQKALDAVGYETPSPIQARTIPPLLEGRDVLGQAQTGTGKTAAFALPILDHISIARREPQAIVLTPTRELAIQVAEAFQRYASGLEGFHVLPIYGGQAYPLQLRPLERGVHVVVGTPGRVIDHLERGSLDLSKVSHFVLDEADEMLNMGFVEDVDKILAAAPDERQIVLFSATMPDRIQQLAETYMRDPEVVRMEVRTTVAETIRQRYRILRGNLKLDALTRILETESYDGMLIFVRTKNNTVELSEKLEARGYASAPLNGDVPQKMREKTVERLKKGKLDILVATDVAARGLDVERISHVINYDMPIGIEPYTHRIGRTGRAGRKGEAILFVKPEERRLLRAIEEATGSELETYRVPTTEQVNDSRIERFKQKILEQAGAAVDNESREVYERVMREVLEETEHTPEQVFAALAHMAHGDKSLLFVEHGRQEGRERSEEEREQFRRERGFERDDRRGKFDRKERFDRRDRDDRSGGFDKRDRFKRKSAPSQATEAGMVRYRVAVGHNHGVKPGSLVGAIANEGDISSEFMGRIEIFDYYSTIDLPEGMPEETFRRLQNTRVRGQKLRIAKWDPALASDQEFRPRKPFKKGFHGGGKGGGRTHFKGPRARKKPFKKF